jgi:hypothetical protein
MCGPRREIDLTDRVREGGGGAPALGHTLAARAACRGVLALGGTRFAVSDGLRLRVRKMVHNRYPF